MSSDKNAARGHQRSWKNLLINKEYQLKFTLVMVSLSAMLMAGLGFWVQSVAKESTKVGIMTHKRNIVCPSVPAPVVAAPTVDAAVPEVVPAEPAANELVPLPTPMPAVVGSAAVVAPPLAGSDEGSGSDAVEPALKRTRVMIDESSITMKLTPPTQPFALSPASFADQVADHWICQMRQAGAINELRRGESKIRVVMVLTSVMLIIGLGLYGIKMTHKVAGPLFKVSLYLNKMRDGRLDKVWNLRKGDQLVDFYEHFKAAHAGLVKLQQGDIVALQAFIAAADTAHQASPLSSDLLVKVAELRTLVTKKEQSLE